MAHAAPPRIRHRSAASRADPTPRHPIALARRLYQIATAVAAEVHDQEQTGLRHLEFGVMVRIHDTPGLDQNALAGWMALLAGLLLTTAAVAQETERQLLGASDGLQMPGSEADSEWSFVSYPGEDGLPSAGRFSKLTGCDRPEGGVSRQDFDATLDRLGEVQPWMDWGQKKSARGFARLQRIFHRRYEELAVYRCETGTAEVPIYFVGIDENGLSGLLTVNIET